MADLAKQADRLASQAKGLDLSAKSLVSSIDGIVEDSQEAADQAAAEGADERTVNLLNAVVTDAAAVEPVIDQLIELTEALRAQAEQTAKEI